LLNRGLTSSKITALSSAAAGSSADVLDDSGCPVQAERRARAP
jgi:hypothetical protein